MNIFEFSLAIGAVSFVAGMLGSLTGLGGGVVVVPVLALGFGVDLHYAIGASLVSVIATSSGAAAAFVQEGFSNIRVGMFLEIATSTGAILGAFLATRVPTASIAIVFGIVLLYSAYQSLWPQKHDEGGSGAPTGLAKRLKLDSSYPTPEGPHYYRVRAVPLGFGLMVGAGTLSGLLGIGSGALKVLAMDRGMRLPFKVSATTSNFMIGVTAAASAGIYLSRGYVDPVLSMPVMLGVLAGSLIGARLLVRAGIRVLRLLFSVVIVVLAAEMIYNGVTGKL
jgi:uncharacterized membrane protein YfcA